MGFNTWGERAKGVGQVRAMQEACQVGVARLVRFPNPLFQVSQGVRLSVGMREGGRVAGRGGRRRNINCGSEPAQLASLEPALISVYHLGVSVE